AVEGQHQPNPHRHVVSAGEGVPALAHAHVQLLEIHRRRAMSASYGAHGPVAVITLDNPPVNGLGHDTRADVVAGLAQANADPAVTAIVILGANGLFSGGADIREFNTPKSSAKPTLLDVI